MASEYIKQALGTKEELMAVDFINLAYFLMKHGVKELKYYGSSGMCTPQRFLSWEELEAL